MLLLWMILMAAVSGKCADEEEFEFFSLGDQVNEQEEETFYTASTGQGLGDLNPALSLPAAGVCAQVL